MIIAVDDDRSLFVYIYTGVCLYMFLPMNDVFMYFSTDGGKSC